jgi:hypothetical protein
MAVLSVRSLLLVKPVFDEALFAPRWDLDLAGDGRAVRILGGGTAAHLSAGTLVAFATLQMQLFSRGR